MIGVARERGLKSVYGIVLSENTRMLNLGRKLGFITRSRSGGEVLMTLTV